MRLPNFQKLIAYLIPLLFTRALPTLADQIGLAQLNLENMTQDWGQPGVDKSVQGNPITINHKVFTHGLGSHGLSTCWIDLGGDAQRFTASVGMDDEAKGNPDAAKYPIEFRVYGDSKIVWSSGKMLVGTTARPVNIDLKGIQTLALIIQPMGRANFFAHGDWANATITYTGTKPRGIKIPDEMRQILTPAPPHTPRINGATLVGVRPGHPLLYAIAATGDRPMTFAADGLPPGLSLDPATGRISGATTQSGLSTVTLKAANALGVDQRSLRIQVGVAIALTPPMGWNSWNIFSAQVTDSKVRAAADAMVRSGLIDHGWTYINIDDGWQAAASQPPAARRDKDGMIQSNPNFPDMKALADYIHSRGLRAGLYSSPGPSTCAGYTGSYQFESQDARQYAQWGYDYLKYDWCSYDGVFTQLRGHPNAAAPLALYQHPYAQMDEELLKQNRDIVFSLCQYGYGDVWTWGQRVGGNCWRTTGDISNNWSSMSSLGFNQYGYESFAGPGHWNDPDMLILGKVGWGNDPYDNFLTPNEQYTHISLWCLLSAPLLLSCDLTQLDDFTLNLLTNDEVLAIDQDPAGRQARRVFADDNGLEIWSKSLENGAKAVGLFNRGEMPARVTVRWAQIGVAGKQSVRDLWRQKDLGEFENQFSSDVPRHGVVLVKIGTPTTAILPAPAQP